MDVKLNELNTKRMNFFFSSDQIEMLVNDVVDNALTDFTVILEHLDNEKFMQFYARMVEDEELSTL